ncbi:MAG: ATP-binding protein [Clostridiales bacterium]|nr:ATP-binding protein [Clostridiales bacterium]
MAKIGKNILENLTTGMYSDSKVAYREYVQNACDQIDKAIDSGIVTPELAEVAIFIDPKKRYVSIEDNATGVREKDFVAQLGDIANSDKKIGVDKGFRGIGRLCGLAYCRTLVFTTSYAGETVASRMSFDAKLMREMLISDKKYTVDEILDAIVTTETDTEEKGKHYFKVELIDINHENTDLLDTAGVRDYLSFVAPVPYTNKFHYRHDIYGHAKKLGFTIDEYKVTVNGAQLFKEYKTRLYEGADNARKIYDDVFGVEFKDFYDGKTLIAWAWYGLCRFEKAIPKALNPMYGFRLRQGNIQIGDNTAVASLFKEDRGNSYFIGEIFTVDKNLIPNSQRNYFNETPARINLEEQLRVFFYDELHRLYHVANETKNHYRKLEAYNDAVAKLQEKHAKGFVDKKEQSRMEATVEDARKKKDAAKKKLEKTVETLTTSSTLTPEQRVQKEIQYKFEKKNVSSATQKAEKKETEIVEQKEEKKSKYFTDNLSKLDKSKRKLVGQIMGIVSQIAPENIAEEIQAAIEKEFR